MYFYVYTDETKHYGKWHVTFKVLHFDVLNAAVIGKKKDLNVLGKG